jgi:hypothetical protein
MLPRRALARLRYEFLSLLLEIAIAAAVLAALIAATPLAVILAAQLSGLASTGQWRGFQLSELFDVLQIDPNSFSASSPAVAGSLLSAPATLVLFTSILFLCVLAGFLHRLNRRERARLRGVHQSTLIHEIESKLTVRRSDGR